jgi:hypothetical protein
MLSLVIKGAQKHEYCTSFYNSKPIYCQPTMSELPRRGVTSMSIFVIHKTAVEKCAANTGFFLYICFAGYSVLVTALFMSPFYDFCGMSKKIWIQTRSAALSSWRAMKLATHLFNLATHPCNLGTHPSKLATHPLT